jgi:galactose mutarotase-like enzyme
MSQIENDFLTITFNSKGAELASIYHNQYAIEYLWNADPAFWGKHSPVLFPIVGALKENKYFIGINSYALSRHGFARDKDFIVTDHSQDRISFSLSDDEESLLIYPFRFRFSVIYQLQENILSVTYEVKNQSQTPMYFSVGGHPAFAVPVIEGSSYEDYYLEFNETETSARWPISKDGLIEKEPVPFFNSTDILRLKKELFMQDALVFKFLTSSKVSLKSDLTIHGWDFDFREFPYLGIWAAKQANFICIEPWCGIADSVDSDQQLINKEGINKLDISEKFQRSWSVAFY